jgi:outer membrane lipoprotein-sorting protein
MGTTRVMVVVTLQISVFFAIQRCSAFTDQRFQSQAAATRSASNQNRPATALVKQNYQPGAAPSKDESKKPEPSKADQDEEALERVLHRMDQTAADFHAAQADFAWTTYNSVANSDVGTDKGRIYFRRTGKETQMAAHVEPPSAKQILFANGEVKVYTPGTNEIQVWPTSAHQEEVEAFLMLGFGSAGSDLRKTFAVTYLRPEKIGDVQTDKLELVPTAANVKQQFPKIDLWIDAEGISRRQQLFQQDGDYRLADYSDIKLNAKLPGDAFKLKTSGSPKRVTH